jgi:hypothetical protein
MSHYGWDRGDFGAAKTQRLRSFVAKCAPQDDTARFVCLGQFRYEMETERRRRNPSLCSGQEAAPTEQEVLARGSGISGSRQ